MKNSLFLVLVLALASCNNEKPAEQVTPTNTVPAGTVADIQTSDSITKIFMLPDSINTALVIATYVEIDPESHTLLMYANTTKKEAKRVRYLDDGSVSSDKLQVVSETVLRSQDKKLEFTINDSMVVSKMADGKLLEHFRTDANN